MNLIDWSLSALDNVFSQRKASPGEASCPDGTQIAGYARDYWNEPLLIEDVEDLFVFGFMIAGFLIIGFGIALVYGKVVKTEKLIQSLSDIIIKRFLDLSERTKGLEQRLEHSVVQLSDLNRNILFRVTEMQKTLGDSIKETGTFRCKITQ